MKTSLVLAIILCVAIIACDKKQPKARGASSNFDKLLELYCSDDPQVALRALLDHRSEVLKSVTNQSHLDYDHILAITDARLFSLEFARGGTNASRFFDSCTNHLTKSRISKGLAPYEYSTNFILNLVTLADTNLNVRWKRRLPRTP